MGLLSRRVDVPSSSSPPVLGDLELAVLEELWRVGDSDAKAVHARLAEPRGIALNTVQSTLERLHRKGVLDRRKVSHAYVYAAKLTREALVRHLLESTVERIAAGNGDTLVAAFVDLAARVDAAQLERMAEIIARHRREAESNTP